MPVHCGPHLGHLLFNAGIYLCVIERSVADGLPTRKFGVWRTQERLNGAAREACVLLCPSRRADPIGPISHRCLSGDCSICDAAVPSDFAPWCGLVGFLLTDRPGGFLQSSTAGRVLWWVPMPSTHISSLMTGPRASMRQAKEYLRGDRLESRIQVARRGSKRRDSGWLASVVRRTRRVVRKLLEIGRVDLITQTNRVNRYPLSSHRIGRLDRTIVGLSADIQFSKLGGIRKTWVLRRKSRGTIT